MRAPLIDREGVLRHTVIFPDSAAGTRSFSAANPNCAIGTRLARHRRSMDVSRRDWLKTAVGGGVGLALGGVIDVPAVKAATSELKLANVTEFTTSCNFCSCGCGMVAAVREGKLITLEGDYDHVVNQGSLCVKGMSMFATHASPQRLQVPRYRARGSDQWVDITWDEAIDKIARKIREVRDTSWIATEKVGDAEVTVNRTDGFAFMGGAQNTNEECYLFQKAARLLGTVTVEHQARL
jgi:formate dehydrogenase major subunit